MAFITVSGGISALTLSNSVGTFQEYKGIPLSTKMRTVSKSQVLDENKKLEIQTISPNAEKLTPYTSLPDIKLYFNGNDSEKLEVSPPKGEEDSEKTIEQVKGEITISEKVEEINNLLLKKYQSILEKGGAKV
ncbi:hypothetical protein [Mycoplasma ovis]|uniref:hypothetical protein n=1 Tax=Mycoplasma ovis TaxID=171632 RepID=UPI001182FE34|nr:hypothetical protein [Mycoplasma ovis]